MKANGSPAPSSRSACSATSRRSRPGRSRRSSGAARARARPRTAGTAGTGRASRASSATNRSCGSGASQTCASNRSDPRRARRRTRANVAKCSRDLEHGAAHRSSAAAANGNRTVTCGGRPRATEAARWRRRKSSTRASTGTCTSSGGSPLVRRHLGHRQRKAFLMRPKKPPSPSSPRYGSSPRSLLELLEQRALRLVEPARDVDAGVHVEVAAPPPLERRHPLAAQHVNVARLGAGRISTSIVAGRAGNRDAWCRAPPASSSGRRRCGGRRRRARCRAAG